MGPLVLGAALQAGGTALSIYGKLKQAKQQATLLRFNARENERSANLLLERGVIEEAQTLEALRASRANLASGYARSGVRVDSGSAFAVQMRQAALDDENLEAFRFGVTEQVRNLRIQAEQQKIQAKQVQSAAKLGAVTSAVQGAGSIMSSGGAG